MWIAGPAVMFAMLYGNDKEGIAFLQRRRLGGLVGEVSGVARSDLESICIAVGAFGASSLYVALKRYYPLDSSILMRSLCRILSLYQWYFVIAVHTQKFTPQEIKQGYDELMTDEKK